MKKEKIKKAADEFAEREYEINDIDKDALHKGFYWGAHWRINSVWHDAKEHPQEHRYILVSTKGDSSVYVVCIIFKPKNWDKYVEEHRIVQWAYIEDLLPNKED